MKHIQTYRMIRVFAILVSLSASVLACTGTAPTASPTQETEPIVIETLPALPTVAIPTITPAPTLTLIPPSPTSNPPTTIPPTAIPPTITASPLPSFSLPAVTRIRFAPGATYGITNGTIRPGQTQNFVLGALQGQPLLAFVNSPDNDVTLSITTQSGLVLLPASQRSSSWQGTLSATQDYYFQIIGGARQEDYSLSISIPSRIQFASGATSVTISGKTVNGYIASYVVAARGGQTMNIQLSPELKPAALTVWGFSDGQPYMRAQMESTTFNMQLPSTQDYIIDVVPQGGQEVNFTLRVEIR